MSNPLRILGLWNMGEDIFHKKINPIESKRIIKKALSMGINTFDSAYSYKDSDSILYSALREAKVERENWKIVEKVMPIPSLDKKVDISRKRLKTDYLDILLLHWPTNNSELYSSLSKLEKLKNEDIIKEYGVSNFPLSLLKKVSLDFDISYHERPLSLVWNKDYEEERKLEIKTLSYGPLGFGFLSKEEKPRLSYLPFYSSKEREKLFATLDKMEEKYKVSRETIAYSWTRQKEPYAIIRGVSSIEQLSLSAIELSSDDIKELDEVANSITLSSPSDNIFSHNYNGDKNEET